MNSPGLADTVMTLEKGRAMVEVAEIRPENNIRVGIDGSSTELLKAGLYELMRTMAWFACSTGRPKSKPPAGILNSLVGASSL